MKRHMLCPDMSQITLFGNYFTPEFQTFMIDVSLKDTHCGENWCTATLANTIINERRFSQDSYDGAKLISESSIKSYAFDNVSFRAISNLVTLSDIEDDTNLFSSIPGLTEEELVAFRI